MPPPLHTLKIWGAGGLLPAELGGRVCRFFVFFVCPSRYDERHRKPRRFVYALNLEGPGISPPDSFSFRSSSSSTTSGDIFYCSGSRQLNHSTPCPEKKRTNSILGISSSNTGRFTQFFHFYNFLEICNKAVVKYPIAPKTRHYTTL